MSSESAEAAQVAERVEDVEAVDAHDGTVPAVSSFELYFDLVFVYAFTQVTSLLTQDPTWRGLARGMLVLAALWWAWVGYAWLATTTILEDGATRIATIVVMCAMLVVGVATPRAFGEHALAFAIAWGAVRFLHVGIYAMEARDKPALLRNVWMLLPGAVVSTTMLTIAAFTNETTALVIWTVAMVLDYAGPLFIDPAGWEVSHAHFSERFGLIFIIALGESLIALGVGASELAIDAVFVMLCALGVLTVSAMWWTYFDVVAIVGERRLEKAHGAERGALARDSYTYLHLPMIAGAILYARGVKEALGSPAQALHLVPATALVGGMAIYLAAHVLFRLRNIRTLNRPRLIASVTLLALLMIGGTQLPAGALVALVAIVMLLLVMWEAVTYRETRARIRARAWRPETAPHPERGSDVAPSVNR